MCHKQKRKDSYRHSRRNVALGSCLLCGMPVLLYSACAHKRVVVSRWRRMGRGCRNISNSEAGLEQDVDIYLIIKIDGWMDVWWGIVSDAAPWEGERTTNTELCPLQYEFPCSNRVRRYRITCITLLTTPRHTTLHQITARHFGLFLLFSIDRIIIVWFWLTLTNDIIARRGR